jgi:threonine dehydratase
MNTPAPDIASIRALRKELGVDIVRTPILQCAGLEDLLDSGTTVFGKLEFLQRTGTFKARGALATIKELDAKQLQAGITAVSAGNHAIAAAFAARIAGTHAKVVMIETANPLRVNACKSYGAEVVMAGDAHEAFAIAGQIQEREGRVLVHPYEGPDVARGTGTLGLEICEQCDDFDALIVPIGGGGLMGGVANAVRQLRPDCRIIGVEPEGAMSMHRSFDTGRPEAIDKVRTIADSLGAPYALPYSFELCRRNVDELVALTDDELRRSMGLLYQHMNLAVEPACAASTAALFGPLRQRLAGQRVMLLFCGSNIDWATWFDQAIFDAD